MAEQTRILQPVLSTSKSGPITKVDAVGQALSNLGKDAGRPDLQAYLKQHFGFDMSPDHISNCRRIFLKKQGKAGTKAAKVKKAVVAKAAAQQTMAPRTAGRKPSAKPKVRKAAAPKPVAAFNGAPTGHGLSLQDVQTTRELLGHVGAAQLRSLIELLAR